MAEFPALSIWTDAYLGDTTHLTTIEHGAYFLLLVTAWRAKTHDLPDDDKLLARYARMTVAQWIRIKPTIAQFWTIADGRWSNGRLLDELEAARRRSKSASTAGQASAERRKNRNSTTLQRISAPIEQEQPRSGGPVRREGGEPSDRIDSATPGPVRREGGEPSDRIDDKLLFSNEVSTEGVQRQPSAEATTTTIATTIATVPFSKENGRGAPVGEEETPPSWWPSVDSYGRLKGEIDSQTLFKVGKAIIGSNAGGQIGKLLKIYQQDLRGVAELLLAAKADKGDPRSWIAAIIRDADHGNRKPTKSEVFPEHSYAREPG